MRILGRVPKRLRKEGTIFCVSLPHHDLRREVIGMDMQTASFVVSIVGITLAFVEFVYNVIRNNRPQ